MYNKEAKEISLRMVFSSFPLIHRQVPMVSKSRHPHAPPSLLNLLPLLHFHCLKLPSLQWLPETLK